MGNLIIWSDTKEEILLGEMQEDWGLEFATTLEILEAINVRGFVHKVDGCFDHRVREWLIKNTNNDYTSVDSDIYFQSEEDAVLFKLTWG